MRNFGSQITNRVESFNMKVKAFSQHNTTLSHRLLLHFDKGTDHESHCHAVTQSITTKYVHGHNYALGQEIQQKSIRYAASFMLMQDTGKLRVITVVRYPSSYALVVGDRCCHKLHGDECA